jgi:protein kinase-like protein/PASTA domain-containing protein
MPDAKLVLADRYQARGRLGNGAGAGVEDYLGRDLRLARQVVIHVIRGAGQDRFARHARLMASLDHPGVASVYDWGQEDDLAYLIREYVPGSDLRTLLAERGPLPVGQAMAVGAEVAAALAAAHRVGLAHGSLDAADVILGDQRVTVVGFGAAWMREVAADHDDRGDAIDPQDRRDRREPHGGPDSGAAYDLDEVPPEPVDVRRDLKGELRGDLQDDLAALGAMLQRMVTGVASERSATVTPMVSTRLTFQVRQVISRLTSSDPIDRYQGAEAVRADLLHLARDSEPEHPTVRPTFAALGGNGRAESRASTEQLAPTRPTWVTAPVAQPGDLGDLGDLDDLDAARRPAEAGRLDRLDRLRDLGERPGDWPGDLNGESDGDWPGDGSGEGPLEDPTTDDPTATDNRATDNRATDGDLDLEDRGDDHPGGGRRVWVVAVIAVGAAVIAGAMVVAAISLSRPDHGSRTPSHSSIPPASRSSGTTASTGVPNVIGLDEQSAIGALQRSGFIANITLRSSNQLIGVVTDQRPRAGERSPLGALVFLTVSTGPPTTVGANSGRTSPPPGPLTHT